MEMENGDPVWLQFNTPDAAEAEEFYSRVFGWRFAKKDNGVVVAFAANGLPVASVAQIDGVDAQWRVYFQVPAVADAARAVASSRGRILLSPCTVEGLGHLSVIEDPTGAVFALAEAPEFEGFAIGTGHGQPAWFEVVSNDFQLSLAFYRAVVGWKYHFVDDDGIMSLDFDEDHHLATNGPAADASAGIVDGRGMLADGDLPHWRTHFAVSDIDAAVDAVRAAGGVLTGGIERRPLGTQVTVTDPQGGRFVLLDADDRNTPEAP